MNKNCTVLYVGVTNNLLKRLVEHYHGAQQKVNHFTAKYNCYYCIAYEPQTDVTTALSREKEVKGWSRKKKMLLAERLNFGLNFLNDELLGKGWEVEYKLPKI